jgi:putative phosphoribosyl transferase
MTFLDRTDAGRQLARVVDRFRSDDPIVLALPRGGVPVAAEVAEALNAPLDLLIVRKVGLPQQPELAMGAVVDGEDPVTVRNEDVIHMAGVSDSTFAAVRDRELTEIRRRRRRYLGDRPHPALRDRTIIVVDDGIATGATMRAALQALHKRQPRRLILAVPVAARDVLEALRGEADEIICLEPREGLGSIGYYYADFSQVSDEIVIQTLATSLSSKPATATGS